MEVNNNKVFAVCFVASQFCITMYVAMGLKS